LSSFFDDDPERESDVRYLLLLAAVLLAGAVYEWIKYLLYG